MGFASIGQRVMMRRPRWRLAELGLVWLALLAVIWAAGCGTTTDGPLGGSAAKANTAVFRLRAFAPWAAVNRPLPADPGLDAHSAAMVSQLNAGEHNADYVAEGTTVFAGLAAHRMTRIVCTEPGWVNCPLAGRRIPLDPRWKPSPGSDRAMVVIDYRRRKVYDLWHVVTDRDGRIAVSANGSIRVAWGGVTALDGSGQSRGATGSGLSHLYGMIRVYEARAAVDEGGCETEAHCALATSIPHAVHVATSMTCGTFRPPAVKSDGKASGSTCVPEGAHLFLDPRANCAFDRHKPIEEAVCFALKRYGAFITDTAGSPFAVGFEGASAGQPGGSGPSPYPAGGLEWDYYNMNGIPWRYLHVAAH